MKLIQLFTIPTLCLLPLVGNAQSSPTKSITFNGIDQYIQIPHHADFNCESDENLTVTAWVYIPNWSSADQRFMSKRAISYDGEDKSGYEMWGGTGMNKFFAVNTPNAAGNHNNSLSAWSTEYGYLNTWTHVAFIVNREEGIIKMYQNGNLVGSSSNKDISVWGCTNTFDVLLGAGWNIENEPTKFSNSSLANVRFYKAALSGQELIEDKNTLEYASLSTALKAKSVAAYDFTGVTGYNLPDLSGKGHNGTFVNFAPIISGPLEIIEDRLIQDINFTGRGNDNEVILHSQLTVAGEEENTDLSQIILTLEGTTQISDISSVKIYSTGSETFFDSRDPENLSGAVLLGVGASSIGEITIPLKGSLVAGINNLWITCEIASEATEGNKVDATLVSLATNHQTYSFRQMSAEGNREILLGRKLLFAHGDKANSTDINTNYYRIPAMVTAKDGSIVTATDRRKNTISDLPADIDVVIRRSIDGGKNWSETAVIAAGQGEGAGFGDAALVQTNDENGLMCVFAGGPGLWTSRYNAPIRIYMCKSTDNGINWSAPVDITSQIYGFECADEVRSQWSALFISSGAGLKMSNGRIGFVGNALSRVTTDASYIANLMVYTDDDGENWNVSEMAKSRNGNEAKLVELNDSRILMSIRNQAAGARYYTTSSDFGNSWSTVSNWAEMSEPGCNGDIIRYTSVNSGYEKNRILHSVPDNEIARKNVSVYISYDEGETWPVKKSICPTGSAYSSLCILSDGTIGAYIEENYNTTPYNMYFVNFSLDWLSSGTDTYLKPDMNIEVISTPIFSIEEGIYSETQTLEITCETPDAKIYYTLDGTFPSETSLLYTGPFQIETTTTVKAIAIKEGMANSLIKSAKIEIFEPAYCVWEGGDRSAGDRYLTQLTFQGATVNGVSQPLTVPVSPNGGQTKVYVDRTEYELNCTIGDQITIGFTKQLLEWMHFYAYIDYNQDYLFDTTAGELVSYSHYEGKDSDGVKRPNSYCPATIPTFTIPSTATPGKTRLRFNIDWNSINPCGRNDAGGKINVDRGSIIDVVINIQAATPASISIVQSQEGGSIIVKNGEEVISNGQNITLGTTLTVEAIPEEDYLLKSILVNGVAIDGNSFVVRDFNTVISAEFTNHKIMTILANQGGNTTVKAINSDQNIQNGDWFAKGEYVFNAIADETYEIIRVEIDGNDESEFISDDKTSFICNKTLTDNCSYEVEFAKKQISFNYSYNEALGSVVVTQQNQILPSGSNIEIGSSLNVTINTSNTVIELTSILINGIDKKADILPTGNKGTFTLVVNEATTMEIIFTKPIFLLSFDNVVGGNFTVFRNYDLDTFEGITINDGTELIPGETLTITFIPTNPAENSPFKILVNDEEYTEADLDSENGPVYPNDGGRPGYLVEHIVDGPVNLSASFLTSISNGFLKNELGYYDNISNMFILAKGTSLKILNTTSTIVLQSESSVSLNQLSSGVYIAVLEKESNKKIVKFTK